MVGVTDRPFRQLCRTLGAGLTVSEMLSADTRLWRSKKSQLRLDHNGEPSPRAVQIVGSDPLAMADAARQSVALGAQIVDINMGCPAKKVCNLAAGSALMRDEALVARILEHVVAAVTVPVTLKIRTGWSPQQRNGVAIAKIAEQSGIQSIAVHGRTRACAFGGEAEYSVIAEIKAAVSVPVVANGDIDSPEKAKQVLELTGADAVMIGRAAQGNPWIFREIDHYLRTGLKLPSVTVAERSAILLGHLKALYSFYGEHMGVQIARKHIGWYCKAHEGAESFRKLVNQASSPDQQFRMVQQFFEVLSGGGEKAA